LGDNTWDLIHFNFGLHDIKHINPINGKNSNSFDDPHQASPNQYKYNLEKIVKILKKTKAKLIFATTTPYPNSKLKPARKPGMHRIYNEVALSVMKKYNIKINDLHSFVLPRMDELQRPYNVHFSKYGSEELAKVVVKSILQNL
jgi:acyl-CoA thioesterase-1